MNLKEFSLSLDIAVALSILGGVVTFILSKLADRRSARHHKAWDNLLNYSALVLPSMLKLRDDYLESYLQHLSGIAKVAADGGKGPDINRLIFQSRTCVVYIQLSFIEAFSAFKSSNMEVLSEKTGLTNAFNTTKESLISWEKDLFKYHVERYGKTQEEGAELLKEINSKYMLTDEVTDYLAFPAWKMTQLYGEIFSRIGKFSAV